MLEDEIIWFGGLERHCISNGRSACVRLRRRCSWFGLRAKMAECSGGAGMLSYGFKAMEEVAGAQRCLPHPYITSRKMS